MHLPHWPLLLPRAAVFGVAVIAGCRSSTEPQGRRETAEPPRQLFIVEPPTVVPVQALDLGGPTRPDTQFYLVRVTAPDSTFAVHWWPTEILVETDRGYRRTLSLSARACLLPAPDLGPDFPLTFTWWRCDAVGINTRTVLTPERLREAVRLAGGDTILTHLFNTRPGGQYRFRVGTGRGVTAAAVERLSAMPEAEEAFRPDASPPCVLSDIVPPPPCDPWWLEVRLPYVVDREAGADTLPISRGGWVRATYTQPDGSTLVTTAAGPA